MSLHKLNSHHPMFTLKLGMSWESDLRTIGKHLSSHLGSIFSLGQEIWWPHVPPPQQKGLDTTKPSHHPPSPLCSSELSCWERGKGEERLVTITIHKTHWPAPAARYVPTVSRKLPGQIVRFGEFGGICPNSRFGKPQTNGISQHPEFSTVNGWDWTEERRT